MPEMKEIMKAEDAPNIFADKRVVVDNDGKNPAFYDESVHGTLPADRVKNLTELDLHKIIIPEEQLEPPKPEGPEFNGKTVLFYILGGSLALAVIGGFVYLFRNKLNTGKNENKKKTMNFIKKDKKGISIFKRLS
jgi:hypothetical protein